ncbi:MAG: L,D-transpeptidase catalytic domain [Candidatus Parcubacteria bacterium]
MVLTQEGGKSITVLVSTGRPGKTQTPNGTFTIGEKWKDYKHNGAAMDGVKAIIPFWSNLTGGALTGGRTGIHYGMGFMSAPDVGKAFRYPSSGGCIRVLSFDTARYIFENASRGTQVVVKGSVNEYLKNPDCIWNQKPVSDLFENPNDSQGKFRFKRPDKFTPQMQATLFRLIDLKVVVSLRPNPEQIKVRPQWRNPDNWIYGFPGAQIDPDDLTDESLQKVYLTRREVDEMRRSLR